MNVHIFRSVILSISVLSVFTMCSELRNPFMGSTSGCEASECHVFTPLESFPPTSGRHTLHLDSVAKINCNGCHHNYNYNPLHKDGVINGYDSSKQIQAEGNIVSFIIKNGTDGSWDDNAGVCNQVGCHFNASDLEWYSTSVSGLEVCAICHKSSGESIRQIYDSNGDGTGIDGDFKKESHHVIDYGNRTDMIVTSSDCIVCHNMSNHMSGAARLNNKDTGQVIVYNPNNPARLEPFCLSCHDLDGAATEINSLSPFSSTNILGTIPNASGTKIKESWDKQYGHRREGVTCMGDGITGCHGNNGEINAHGSDNYGLLSGNMNFRIGAEDVYNESDYELCFSCHANYPGITKEDILGVKEGGSYDYVLELNPPGMHGPPEPIVFGLPPYYTDSGVQTRFLDTDAHIHGSGDYQYHLHWFHISMRIRDNSGSESADVWLYRGEGTVSDGCSACHSSNPTTGRKATCIACHNVHGSNTSFGFLYDEYSMTHNVEETTGIMGMSSDDLVNAPFYCGVVDCHIGNASGTNYIFHPTNE